MPLVIPFPNIDPVALAIGPLAIRWYALSYVAGLVLGAWWIARLAARPALWPRGVAPMAPPQAYDLMAWVAIGLIAGGRLGYVIFYAPGYHLANPHEILAVWRGGMSFHGGLIGAAAAGWLFARRNGIPVLAIADSIACSVTIGLFLGRLANFVNGELWGRPSDAPWAVVFPDPAAGGVPRHPSQIYEALLEGALLFAALNLLAWRFGLLRRPGQAIGLFLVGYAIARIVVENVREPDAGLGYLVPVGAGGITMGMLLSVPMILVGGILVVWSARRARPG